MPSPIAVDYESFFSKKLKYGLSTMIPESYCAHELFDAYLLSVSDGKECWSGHPSEFNWDSLKGRVLLSHNARFDQTVYLELVRRGLAPKLDIPAWHCTANLAVYLCNRRSLQESVEHLFNHRVSKDYRGVADGKHWPDEFSESERRQIMDSGRSDALWCWRIFDKYGAEWPEIEKRLSDQTIRMGMRGVQIDKEKLNRYLVQAHDMRQTVEQLIPWIAESEDESWDEFNTKPTSTKCIAEQCRRSGIPCPPVKSDDEEAYVEWEARYSPKHTWIKAVNAWRVVNKMLQTFVTVKDRLRSDGTLPFSLKYFGAHCFTGDHEVLTPEGWCRLDHWKGGQIMQWKKGRLLFDEAIPNVFSAPEERLLRVSTGQVEFVCTQGHWLATINKRGELIGRQAEEARKVRLQIPLSGEHFDGVVNLPDWKIRLFVAVQADGHYFKDCRSIRFRLKRQRKIKRLRSILENSGLDWKEVSYPSEPDVRVFLIRQFPYWLEGRKTWGKECLAWSWKNLKIFIEELAHWDGCRCGPGSTEYITTNKQNAEWVVTIAHLVGCAATVTEQFHKNPNWKTTYHVFIREAQKTRVSPKHWTDEGPAGLVYCPTAKQGVCLFRYRGKIFVSKQTGRWSGDARVNFQNMRKKPVLCNEHGFPELDEKRIDLALDAAEETGKLPDWVKFSIDFRSLIIPRPGKKMIVSDLSQIEPRVLAWLVGDWDMLNRVAAGDSVYEAHAKATMGYTGDKMDKNSAEYKLAKARVLGLGYQCGWEKFITMAWSLARLDITANDPEEVEEVHPITGAVRKMSGYGHMSKKTVAEFRAQNPKIVALWERLGFAFRSSVATDFTMTLPNGRKMRYEKVRVQYRIEKDKDTGLPRRVTQFAANTDGNWHLFYGGKLTENLVQATARDVFSEHLDSMDRKGLTVLFHVHDEAVLEVDPQVTAQDIEHEMSYCPEWLEGCPIAAHAVEVSHYLK